MADKTDNVMIFKKLVEHPSATIPAVDTRIYCNGQWVDFRDGVVPVTSDSE